MNRTRKEAPVNRSYDENHQQLREHLHNFLKAYTFAQRFKTLQGLTPYEYLIKGRQNEPPRFLVNPTHHKVELNI